MAGRIYKNLITKHCKMLYRYYTRQDDRLLTIMTACRETNWEKFAEYAS